MRSDKRAAFKALSEGLVNGEGGGSRRKDPQDSILWQTVFKGYAA
jgi:hypothetical protein